MKNKVALFLILLFLAFPFLAKAFLVPTANLTVKATSNDATSSFDFKFQAHIYNCVYNEEDDTEVCNYLWQDLPDFSLQAGSQQEFLGIDTFSEYRITEQLADGFEITGIQCTSDDGSGKFIYTEDSVKISAGAYSNITCVFDNFKIPQKTPVLIVPGLMGTEMKKGDELIWPNIPKMFLSISDDFMDVLSFADNLEVVDSDVYIGNVIEKEPSFDYTQGLISEFEGQGYTEGETLFLFAYDWRYGVSGKYANGKTNADLLKEKIDEILQQTGAQKIDVVAHSMGGLVVKEYVKENFEDNKIEKAVFVGVPNLGSVKAVKALVYGDSMGVSFGILGLSDSEVKEISKNMPSAYDLLPSQQYYNAEGSFITTINEATPTDENPGIESQVKDLNYQETKSFLTEDYLLNGAALSGAEDLHNLGLDDFDLRTAGIDLYAINGCKTATISKIIEKRYTTLLGEEVGVTNVKFLEGDGTVALASAQGLPINSDNLFYAVKTEHGNLMSQDNSRQKIVNLVLGSSLDFDSNIITQDKSKCQIRGTLISIFSPVDISATDQSGNFLGPSDDKSIKNEIPGADFEIFGDHKFVFLPTDSGENYQINLVGTGVGTFTLKSEQINGDQIIKTEVFSNLPVTETTTGNVNLGQETTLVVYNESREETTYLSDDKKIVEDQEVSKEENENLVEPVSSGGGGNYVPTDFLTDVSLTDTLFEPSVSSDVASSSIVLGPEPETQTVALVEPIIPPLPEPKPEPNPTPKIEQKPKETVLPAQEPLPVEIKEENAPSLSDAAAGLSLNNGFFGYLKSFWGWIVKKVELFWRY